MLRFFDSPDEAEAAFYDAFETADVAAMNEVWADTRGVTCIHPVGKPLKGPQAVRKSWMMMFRNGPEMHFRIRVLQKTRTEDLSVHIVAEHIRVAGETDERPPVIATNIYRRCADGWRMILHHASPTAATGRADGRRAMGQRVH
jgi:ketosteroid isomerase-like protein